MPLRDHFRPPVDRIRPWEELAGQWSPRIVQQLRPILPPDYIAGPRLRLGCRGEDDIVSEVRIYQTKPGRPLVATIKLVSPVDKDRLEHREAFTAHALGLVHMGVAVSIVDVVTTRDANLYAGLMSVLGYTDPTLTDDPPPLYASSCRNVERDNRALFESWIDGLTVGRPLPTIPLWLSENICVPLDLDSSYEQACSDLSIP